MKHLFVFQAPRGLCAAMLAGMALLTMVEAASASQLAGNNNGWGKPSPATTAPAPVTKAKPSASSASASGKAASAARKN